MLYKIIMVKKLKRFSYLIKVRFHNSVNTPYTIIKLHHIVQLRKQHKKPFQSSKSIYMFSSLTIYNNIPLSNDFALIYL